MHAGELPADDRTAAYLTNPTARRVHENGTLFGVRYYEGNCTCVGGPTACTIPRDFFPAAPCVAVWGSALNDGFREIAPTAAEKAAGWFYHSKMLDMFWVFRPDGKSYLDEKLKAEGVDTVVIAGLWTDECIVATAYAALSRGWHGPLRPWTFRRRACSRSGSSWRRWWKRRRGPLL